MSRFIKVLGWAGGWIIGIGTIVMITLGLALARLARLNVGASPGSFAFRHPMTTAAIGWLLLVAAILILIGTMTARDGTPSRWVKALPGLLAVATLNAIGSFFSGHVTNLPSRPISHTDALAMTLLFLGSTIASAVAFRGRRLNFVDRAALVGLVVFSGWAFVEDSATGLAGCGKTRLAA
jgi:hypothetical protein